MITSRSPNNELLALLERLKIDERVASNYALRLIFVTNATLDDSGASYARARKQENIPLEIWDRKRLLHVAERTRHPGLLNVDVELPIMGDAIDLSLEQGARLIVAFLPATDLVRLPGLDDMTLFDPNVRLGLGRTRINRELARTIREAREHPYFPAYHNGLTLLTHKAQLAPNALRLDGIAVVNGCQSMRALYDNRGSITPRLTVLAKIVELGNAPGLDQESPTAPTTRTRSASETSAQTIASSENYSAKCNSTTAAFSSTRSRVAKRRRHKWKLTTKAAQLLLAVWLKEPWNAVRKVRLFDERYHDIFNRRIDCHKIYLAHLIDQVVGEVRDQLLPELNSSFSSIRFTLAFLVGEALRLCPEGERLLSEPQLWLPEQRAAVRTSLAGIVDEIVQSSNFYITDQRESATDDEIFDPKVAFKSQGGVRKLTRDVIGSFRRFARRSPELLFSVPRSER